MFFLFSKAGKFKTSIARVPYNKLLTNLASSSRTGEYWPSVVFVRTSLRSVRTATTSGQYSPVRPSRSVSKRLLQRRTTNSQTNSHNFKKLNLIYFQWLSLPVKVNRDKLVSISCLWKCRNGERLTIAANSVTKIDQLDGFRPLWRSGWENSARSRNQSDCRICWIPPAHELKIG